MSWLKAFSVFVSHYACPIGSISSRFGISSKWPPKVFWGKERGQYIKQRRKRMKNSSPVPGYPLYITDVYKILLPWCIRLKTILLQAAYHDYSKLRTLNNSQYCLRNWDFEIPRFNTTGYGKHTIRYQGPYIWSKLSKELRTSPTLAIFKRIRKLDLSDLIDNNSSCCKLCKSWTESFYIIS